MKNPRELLTAGAGGIAATVVDVLLLILMVEHGVSVPTAAFLAATAGAVVCFLMNKYIAFRDRTSVTIEQIGRFGAVAVTTAMLMALSMKIVAVHLGVPYLVAKLVCAATIFVVWAYPAQRRLVFARPMDAGASMA
ncbi:MAG: GtrA family protein [Deltaproteobacteria bacterium]|nr:GtrA family protein [Deltaproteobacteria bacterium]